MHSRKLNANSFYELSFRQHEKAAKTYTTQWSSNFETGVTISSSTWTTEDANLTIANEANDNDEASARISASSTGIYQVINQIVDSNGDTDERIFTRVF